MCWAHLVEGKKTVSLESQKEKIAQISFYIKIYTDKIITFCFVKINILAYDIK